MIPDHVRLGILSRRADLIKKLISAGYREELLNGKTINEMEELLEALE
jgi:hypothetical protein